MTATDESSTSYVTGDTLLGDRPSYIRCTDVEWIEALRQDRSCHRLKLRGGITGNMPEAELLCQRQAYRAGLLCAAGILAVIFLAMGTLAATPLYKPKKANAKTAEALQNIHAANRAAA